MDTAERLTAQARRMTAARSTAQLIMDFATADVLGDLAAAEKDTDTLMAICKTRGWIMDELETRDPGKFAAWMETDNCEIEDLRRIYGC